LYRGFLATRAEQHAEVLVRIDRQAIAVCILHIERVRLRVEFDSAV